MSESDTELGRGYFGKLIRGIIKLLLAGFIVGVVSSITIPDLAIGDSSVPGSLIKALLQFAVPIYIILSALEDFGVKL
jgi:hypothetical protein